MVIVKDFHEYHSKKSKDILKYEYDSLKAKNWVFHGFKM